MLFLRKDTHQMIATPAAAQPLRLDACLIIGVAIEKV
jgi:hypothetical protein